MEALVETLQVANPRQEILPDLQVNHTLTNPVFIVGHARSGTSIMVKMIRKYLKVNFGTESQFVIRYLQKIDTYGDLNDDNNLRALIADLAEERCFKRWKRRFGFQLDADKVFQSVEARTYRGVLDAVFGQFADYHQMARWGDKTPEYLLNLEELRSIFPEAQFIHIVRDGRDVALSNFTTQFGAKNAVMAAYEWRRKIQLVRDFGRTLPHEQFIEVRYEDFMRFPQEVFGRLSQFLQIDDRSGALQRFIAEEMKNDLRSGNIMKWRKSFSRRANRDYEYIAGDLLEFYGFQTRTKKRRRLTPLENVFWWGHNLISKLLQANYWKDNLYKLGLRSRAVKSHVRNKKRNIRIA